MYLFDLDQDIAINLRQQNNYQLIMNSKKKNLGRMKLVTGSEDFVLQNSDRIPLKPLEFKLYHNYPNPFNPMTRISFDLPKRAQVELYIYNIMGQRVRKLADHMFRGGHHELTWDGRSDSGNFVSSGLYFIRLKSGTHVATQKMMIVK
ncbi:T9SS type A sorting domain-containing protein [candidate division KSB1 bacterium]|nr:T9SS type A sorting domain-containing protein [candidate division KSB1 bacterium]